MRLRFLLRRSHGEVDEELRFHLERQIEENVAKGMTPEEARRQAVIAFGGVERAREEAWQGRRGRDRLWRERWGRMCGMRCVGFGGILCLRPRLS